MQQLRCSIIEKLSDLTRAEMNIFLLLVRFQDPSGLVVGVYYKDICEELEIRSKQTFYNVLSSLTRKGLIKCSQSVKGDYDITVVGNACWNEEENEPYINMNRRLFRSRKFYRMKAKEKYLLLDFMRSTAQNKGKRVLEAKKLYDRYCETLHVTKRVLQKYLHTLKQYFHIFIKGKNYHILFCGGEGFEAPVKKHAGKCGTYKIPYGAAEQQRDYMSEVLLRRSKIPHGVPETTDVAGLIKQYAAIIEERGKKISAVFWDALEAYKEQAESIGFSPKLLHLLLRREIGIE